MKLQWLLCGPINEKKLLWSSKYIEVIRAQQKKRCEALVAQQMKINERNIPLKQNNMKIQRDINIKFLKFFQRKLPDKFLDHYFEKMSFFQAPLHENVFVFMYRYAEIKLTLTLKSSLSNMMLKNGQAYFKNLAVFNFSILCMG